MTGRSFLLDPLAGWRDEAQLCASVVAGPQLRLAADTDGPFALNDPAGGFGGLADPTGAAMDAEGRAYRIDPAACRLQRLTCDGWAPIACSAALVPGPAVAQSGPGCGLRGLTTTPRGDVVVADSTNGRLLVLAADGVALRRIIGAPAISPHWTPWDVAAWRGRILVSDRSGGLVHVLTCDGEPVAAWDGAGDDPAAPALGAPTALAVDRSGRIYVAQDGDKLVRVLDAAGRVVELRETTEGLEERFCPPAFTVDAAGVIGLVGQMAPPSPRYATAGTFVTTALDSRRHRCVWHRIGLAAGVPAGTSITVRTLTAEVPLSAAEAAALPADRWAGGQVHGVVGDAPWDCLVLSPPGRYLWLRLELVGGGATTPVLRAIRIGYPRVTTARFLPAVFREESTAADFTERFVALLDEVRAGVDRRIDSVPALLDPNASPDGSAGGPDFLGFLAAWLGLSEDVGLPSYRRRRLVAEAHRLYRLRGTPAGIRLHLEICTGLTPYLLEDFALRRWLYVGSGRTGDCAAVWGADVVARMQLDSGSRIGGSQLVGSTDPLRDPFHVSAHRFQVYLPAAGCAGEEDLRRLAERVVELAKPAHTEGRVLLVKPRMRVGVQAYLGVDSVVGAYPTQTQEGVGRLGSDTVLGASTASPAHPSLRVGRTTRVGTATVLD
jgi:phage tail-like protein